jgi:hypothetical protein
MTGFAAFAAEDFPAERRTQSMFARFAHGSAIRAGVQVVSPSPIRPLFEDRSSSQQEKREHVVAESAISQMGVEDRDKFSARGAAAFLREVMLKRIDDDHGNASTAPTCRSFVKPELLISFAVCAVGRTNLRTKI